MADIRPGYGAPATGTGLLQGLIDSPAFFLRLGPAEMTLQEIATEVARNIDFFQEQCRLFCEWMDGYADALRTRSRNGPPMLDPQSEEYRQKRKRFERAQKEFEEGKRTRKPVWLPIVLKDYMTACQGDDYCLTFQSGAWRPVELVHPLGYFGLPVEIVPRGHVQELSKERRRQRDCVLLSYVHSQETRDDAAEPSIFPAYSKRNFDLLKFWWDLREKLETPAGEGTIQRAWVRIEAFLKDHECGVAPSLASRSLAMKVPNVDNVNDAADTPAGLAKDIADILARGGMRRDIYDRTGLTESRFDEFETRKLFGIILNRYNELCKSYQLPPLQIDASDPFVCLGEIQRLLAIRAEGQTPRYVFKNEGATWRIIYEGHEKTVDDSLGMKYIRYLLEHPNTSIECRDIERACSEESPEGGRRMDSGEAIDAGLHTGPFDLKQLENWEAKDIQRAIDKLEQDAENADDPVWKAELQGQAGTLRGYLRKNVDKRGRARPVGDREEARWRVQKAISTAKRAIKKANEQIGSHFEAVRGEGTAYIYKPSSEIPWVFE